MKEVLARLASNELKATPTSEQRTNPTPSERASLSLAVAAAESKKATDLLILDLRGVTSFTDYFVICTGNNQRQIQVICDEVLLKLKHDLAVTPIGVEGFDVAEWVLADYGDFILHVFSPAAREYYDLARLWRSAKPVAPDSLAAGLLAEAESGAPAQIKRRSPPKR